jgi:hypothetical protein
VSNIPHTRNRTAVPYLSGGFLRDRPRLPRALWPRRLPRVALVLLVSAGLLCLPSLPLIAFQPDPVGVASEYTLKAVFLYSFGRYIDWPPEYLPQATGAFVIGVLGDDPFGDALDKIAAAKKIHDRQIVLRRFKSLAEYQPCHILFVTRSVPAEQQAEVIRKLQDKPLLLVGEMPGFAAQGGTVNFFVDQDTVRFEINLQAAKQQKLSINAKLLSLARLLKQP